MKKLKRPTLLEKLQKDFGVIPYRIVSGHNVKKGKPEPEPYLIALNRSGFDKEECMVVENAPWGSGRQNVQDCISLP